MIRRGNDWQSGDLRQRHRAVLHDVARAARAVGRDGEVVTALRPCRQFEQRLRPAPARRTTHRLDAETFKDGREKRAVAAGTDESRETGGLMMPASEDGIHFHRKRQPVVPGAKNHLDNVLARYESVRVVDAVTQCRRDQTKHDPKDPYAEPLMPFRRMRHDHARLRCATTRQAGLWASVLHHAPFFRHARTKSSTVAFAPSPALRDAVRTASCASICLKPSAISASTASLSFWSSGDNARRALAASHAPAAPILSRSSTMMRSAVFLPTPEICESAFTSPPATAPRNAVTLMPLKMFSAIFGPMPETVLTSSRNKSRSAAVMRSEERRVGKECRSRWSPY